MLTEAKRDQEWCSSEPWYRLEDREMTFEQAVILRLEGEFSNQVYMKSGFLCVNICVYLCKELLGLSG